MRSTRTRGGASMPRLRFACRTAAARGLATGLFGGLARGLAGGAVASLLMGVAPASGQSVTLHFDLDGDPFSSSEVIDDGTPRTWTVFASFTGYDHPDAHFLSFMGSFEPTGGLTGTVRNAENLLDQSFLTPVVDGARIESIFIENNTNFQGLSYTDNPLAIFRFEFVASDLAGGDGMGDPDRLAYDAIGTASVKEDEGIFTLPDEFEAFAVISDVLVVPGASVGGALVLGVVGARRRSRGSEGSF